MFEGERYFNFIEEKRFRDVLVKLRLGVLPLCTFSQDIMMEILHADFVMFYKTATISFLTAHYM
jgi:hypothetical protein